MHPAVLISQMTALLTSSLCFPISIAGAHLCDPGLLTAASTDNVFLFHSEARCEFCFCNWRDLISTVFLMAFEAKCVSPRQHTVTQPYVHDALQQNNDYLYFLLYHSGHNKDPSTGMCLGEKKKKKKERVVEFRQYFFLPVIGGSPLKGKHKGSTGSKTLCVSASGI